MTLTTDAYLDEFCKLPGAPQISINSDGITCAWPGERFLQLIWYGAQVVRVRHWLHHQAQRPSLAVTAQPNTEANWSIGSAGDVLTLTRNTMTVSLTTTGDLSFGHGDIISLTEIATKRLWPPSDLPNAEDANGAEAVFSLQAKDALYGLGQFPDGVMNWRGQECTLIHGNISIAVPVIVSSNNWGILWDNASHTQFKDSTAGMKLSSEVADGHDYYVMMADNPAGVVAAYRQLTGVPPIFPRAFYGFIQCKERYKSAEELYDIVAESRRRQLPLDVIVQDWLYWGRGMHRWSCMRHDPESYGDLPAAIEKIHAAHAKVMISIWPRIGQDSDLGKELAGKGLLFEGHPKHEDKVYDAFNPEARAIYWRYVKEGLGDLGIDAWWMDGTEPEFEDCHETLRHKASALRQRDTAAGSWARVLNAYSLATCQGVYEHHRADYPDKRAFILTRSSFIGQQRNAAAVWSGDISATWRTFAQQIPAGLNFCATGQPYWTTDNGAFFVRGRGATFPDGVEDPAFRELFVRWFQYSCFCPLMRSHGTQTPREIWQFGDVGDPLYESLADFARLRMRLLPYSYSLAAATTFEHATPMRPLGLVFTDDPNCHAISDQFMYGDALMACPVTEPMGHPPTERLVPFAPGDLLDAQGKHGALTMTAGDGVAPASAGLAPDTRHKRVILIDETWAGNKPAGTTQDHYWVRFSGQLRVGTDSAPLLIRVAGGVRLYGNGTCLLDDPEGPDGREHIISLAAYAGSHVDLQVDYMHTHGDAVIQVGWQQAVPAERVDAAWERAVYLPRGTWYDFFTGVRHSGEQTILGDAPIEQMPVYVRAGSILPLGPMQEWHDQKPDAPWEIRIYPGQDASYTIYEDDGESYDYESGACSRVTLHWDDSNSCLSFSERSGQFTGQGAQRDYHIVLVRDGHGIGCNETMDVTKICTYSGKAMRCQLTTLPS